MIERSLRWAVGISLAVQGDDEEVLKQLARVDPLCRKAARKRLQDQIEAVLQQEPTAQMGNAMLRRVAGNLGYGSVNATSKPPPWLLSGGLVITLVCSLALVVRAKLAEPPPFEPEALVTSTESADAFEKGGRPKSLGEAGNLLFSDALPGFILALDRSAREPTEASNTHLLKAQDQLLKKSSELLDEDLHRAMGHVVESCQATLVDGASVREDTDEFNRLMEARGLAYYLDADSMVHGKGRSPVVFSHLVENVHIYDVGGGQNERVLWLRRLDDLAIRTNKVGSTHEGASVAVIRRDLVDNVIVEDLLPALKNGHVMELWPIDFSQRSAEERDKVQELAAQRVREAALLLGADADDTDELGNLLMAREEIFSRSQDRAHSKGFRVSIPVSYRIPVEIYKPYEEIIGGKNFRELGRIDDALAEPDMGLVYSILRGGYVESVEFHELQHRLDYRRFREKGLKLPEQLRKYVREPDAEVLSKFARRLTTEYSAFLAQIAHSQIPYIDLVLLSQHVLDKRGWKTTYAETALAVFENLASSLELEHQDFIKGRRVQRIAMADLILRLLNTPKAALQGAAKQVWDKSFGASLVRPRKH